MYAIVDSCLLCLTSSDNLKSIIAKDNDGTVIEDKCKYILFEFVDIKPEITNICLLCLQKLNDACTFKKLCIQNINTIKNYISTLTNLQGMHKPLQITLNDLKNNAVTLEKESYSNSTKEQLEEDLKKTNEVIDVSNNHSMREEFDMEEEINDIEYEFIAYEEIKTEKLKDFFEETNTKVEKSEDIYEEKYEEEPLTVNDLDSCLQVDTTKNTDTNSTCTSGGKNQSVNNGKQWKWKCKECDKLCSSACDLRKHSRTHTGETPFKCSICERKFSQSSNLATHKRTHTGEKPYECDMCNKTFTSKSYLIVHKRIHNNERPFQCLICKKTCTRNGALTEHMRTHSGEKPFQCHLCQNKFTRHSDLKNHMFIHTGEKQHTCKHCQVAFTHLSNLRRHIRRQHTHKN